MKSQTSSKDQKKTKAKISKNKIILISSITITLIIIISLILFLRSTPEKEFKSLGKEFYINFFYPNIDEDSTSEILDNLKDTGIQITLQELIDYRDKYTKKEISSELKKCDLQNSIVYIYPISPYSKSDYKVEVKLDC